MNITILGAGNMGAAFVKRLSTAGHTVRVTAREPKKAEALAAQFTNVQAVPPSEAAQGADVVIIATPYESAVAALRAAGDLTGKVVLDITNPLTADYMGLSIGHSTSAAEQIAQAVPGVRVVKAFNTIFAQVLAAGGDLGAGQRATVFVAADDAAAKEVVVTLAQGIGFQVQDAGGLKNARYLEPLAGLNIYFGYAGGLGTQVAPAWVRQA